MQARLILGKRVLHMDFFKLRKYLDEMVEEFGVPGCDCTIYKEHEQVFRHKSGFSDFERTKSVSENDMYWLYSTSKITTCTAALQLVERGVISLSDPVSKYLPEYADITVRDNGGVRPAKTVMTIEHLFTMSSGLDYQLDKVPTLQVLAKYGEEANTRQLVESFAKSPLLFDPGCGYFYSLSHDVLAAVVEVASGIQFSKYVEENIFKPLGMRDSGYHMIPERRARMAAEYRVSPDYSHLEYIGCVNPYIPTPAYESGGAGIISCVDEYVRVLDALANGGVGITGAQILKPETIDNMRTARIDPRVIHRFFGYETDLTGYSYGLGVRTRVSNEYSKVPIGEFGWDGAAGAYALIDPENHIAVFYEQHILNHLPVTSRFHPAIRELVYEGFGF